MATRDITFKISADDKAGDVFKRLAGSLEGVGHSAQKAASAAQGSGGAFSSLGNALGNMATVAGGIVAAQVFNKIASGIGAFITTGIEAVGQAQQLEASLGSLLTSNNMYKQVTEQVTTAVTKQLMSEEELASKHDQLTAKLNTQRATYQEQEERIRQLTEQYGENGLVVIKTKSQHEELALAIQRTEQDIAGLTATQTKYETSTTTSFKKVMDMAEAQKLAARQTQELMDYISKLAVVSPFETQNVEAVAKYAVAAGLSVDQTKKFTGAFLDLAASVGIGSESLDFAADQLLQVKKVGKLTEVDLRQLRRMGIDLSKVIGVEMGMSVEEFNKKAETTPEIFDQLFDAVANFSQNTFAGTSKKMATSVKGLQSTLSDIFTIGARSFFRPLVEAATPAMNEIIGKLSDAVLGGAMDTLGKNLASKASAIFRAFGRSADEGFRMIGYFLGKAFDDALPVVQGMMGQLSGYLTSQWQTVVMPALAGWATQFWGWLTGTVIPGIPGQLSALVTAISSFLSEQWPTIKEKLTEWSEKFWDWAKEASAKGIKKLGELTQVFIDWANDPETQAKLNTMGEQIGKFLIDAIAIGANNKENSDKLSGALLKAIGMAVVGIGGALLMAGGQIVAGIFAGIGNHFTGGNYKPWTIAQFRQFADWVGDIDWHAVGSGLMSKIGEGLASLSETVGKKLADAANAWKKIITETKWSELGANIVKGIVKGITDNVGKVYEVIKGMAKQAIQEAMASWGISSPSKEFMKLAQYAVQGLTNVFGGSNSTITTAINKMLQIDTRKFDVFSAIQMAAENTEKTLDDMAVLSADKIKMLLRMMKEGLKGAPKLAAGSGEGAIQELLKRSVSLGALGIEGGVQGGAVTSAIERMANLFVEFRSGMPGKTAAQAAANFEKLAQGFSKFANEATGAGTELNQRIATLQTLLRNGAQEFNLEGKIMNAAQAQEYLNGLITEQTNAQAGLAQISGLQAGVQAALQNKQALGMLGGKRALNMDQILQTAMAALSTIGTQMLPGLKTGDLGALGNVKATQNNFTLNVTTTGQTENLLADFALLQSLLPSGT